MRGGSAEFFRSLDSMSVSVSQRATRVMVISGGPNPPNRTNGRPLCHCQVSSYICRVYVSEQMKAVGAAEAAEAHGVPDVAAGSLWNWREVNNFLVEICNTIRARFVMM